MSLDEGDWCTIGIPGSPLPSKICGPGLTCVAHEGQHATCESSTLISFFFVIIFH